MSDVAPGIIDPQPFGWLGTRTDGSQAVFSGARPREAEFPQLDALTAQSDFEAALWALRNPPLTLDEQKTAKLAELSQACSDAITSGGFASSALGAVHGYPLDRDSQLNLSASVTASLLPGLAADWTTPFWCADANGTWSFAPHTAAQIQQVGRDGMAVVVATRLQLKALSDTTRAATTPAGVAAVTWA